MRFIGKMNPAEAAEWFEKAAEESPGRREPFVDLAKHYYDKADWENCYKYAQKALDITEKLLDYMCEEESWGWLPWDLAAISLWNLGGEQKAKAAEYGKVAVELAPSDERLKKNLEFYLAN